MGMMQNTRIAHAWRTYSNKNTASRKHRRVAEYLVRLPLSVIYIRFMKKILEDSHSEWPTLKSCVTVCFHVE